MCAAVRSEIRQQAVSIDLPRFVVADSNFKAMRLAESQICSRQQNLKPVAATRSTRPVSFHFFPLLTETRLLTATEPPSPTRFGACGIPGREAARTAAMAGRAAVPISFGATTANRNPTSNKTRDRTRVPSEPSARAEYARNGQLIQVQNYDQPILGLVTVVSKLRPSQNWPQSRKSGRFDAIPSFWKAPILAFNRRRQFQIPRLH